MKLSWCWPQYLQYCLNSDLIDTAAHPARLAAWKTDRSEVSLMKCLPGR
jgi:hypothetical protein